MGSELEGGPWITLGLLWRAWRASRPLPETHLAITCVFLVHQPLETALLRLLQSQKSGSQLHLGPRKQQRGNKQILGQKLIPSWGTGGVKEKKSLLHSFPIFSPISYGNEMSAIKSSSCLILSKTSFNTSPDSRQMREKPRRKLFSCESCDNKRAKLTENPPLHFERQELTGGAQSNNSCCSRFLLCLPQVQHLGSTALAAGQSQLP